MLCGSAKNMNQLIFSRAFQGIGGGGMQTYAYRPFHFWANDYEISSGLLAS